MGLFSKKEYVCERCGKTFTARLTPADLLCKECWQKKFDEDSRIEKAVQGYKDYASKYDYKTYSTEELYTIYDHREAILAKSVNMAGISKAELQAASDNYKKLSDEEAESVLVRMANSLVSATIGAVSAGNCFVPTQYDGVIVDAESVFAVGFTSDYNIKVDNNSEVILCAVFTNDPYVPVFPMVYAGQKGLFELTKSKKGRASVTAMFESMCPNLTYPVCDLKELKKQIKADGAVNGNIDKKKMIDQIEQASVSMGLFDTKKMHSDLLPGSVAMLDSIGYMQADEADKILKMDKMFNKNFWNKHIKRLANS